MGAFLLARYLVRDLVVHYVSKKWPKWELVDHMLVRSDLVVVLQGRCGASCSIMNCSAGLQHVSAQGSGWSKAQ